MAISTRCSPRSESTCGSRRRRRRAIRRALHRASFRRSRATSRGAPPSCRRSRGPCSPPSRRALLWWAPEVAASPCSPRRSRIVSRGASPAAFTGFAWARGTSARSPRCSRSASAHRANVMRSCPESGGTSRREASGSSCSTTTRTIRQWRASSMRSPERRRPSSSRRGAVCSQGSWSIPSPHR